MIVVVVISWSVALGSAKDTGTIADEVEGATTDLDTAAASPEARDEVPLPELVRPHEGTWLEYLREKLWHDEEHARAAEVLVRPSQIDLSPILMSSLVGGETTRWSLALPEEKAMALRQVDRAFHSDGMLSLVYVVDEAPGSTIVVTADPTGHLVRLAAHLPGRAPWTTFMDSDGRMWWGESRAPKADGCMAVEAAAPMAGPVDRRPTSEMALLRDVDSCAKPVISVMVLFTEGARVDAGGTGETAIRADIHDALVLANASYANAEIALAVADVAVGTVGDLDEEDLTFEELLDGLTESTDGFLDSYITPGGLRDLFAADAVVLVVGDEAGDNVGSDVCGKGWIMPPTSFQDRAFDKPFSVVRRSCLATYSLAHELGHNLGAHHDRD